MDMISPAEWGARVNYDGWSDRHYQKDLIAVHWGGPPPNGYDQGPAREAEILRSYENYHLDTKGWRGIAYGYAIGASGTVYRLRGKNQYGAHQGDYDMDGISNNKEVIPVLFIMGEGQTATPEMWASLRELWLWLGEQPWCDWPISVLGHKAVQTNKPTACPGQAIIDALADGSWADDPNPPVVPIDELTARVEALELAVSLLQEFEAEVRQL